MQRTDPISLRLVHRVNRKSADLVIVIVVTVDDQLVFAPSLLLPKPAYPSDL